MNDRYENEILHKMYTEAMQENSELKDKLVNSNKQIVSCNSLGCLFCIENGECASDNIELSDGECETYKEV
jgi:nitrite reductase/ring-hydroxylating ferredoxin subunit